MNTPLPYASPTTLTPPTWMLRVAFACWIVPLIFGVTSAAAWRISGHDAFQIVGLFTLLIGCGLFLVGVVLLVTYRVWILSKKLSNGWRVSRFEILLLCLLVSNFPAAGGIIAYVNYEQNRYHVLIINNASAELKDAMLIGDSKPTPLGNVPQKSSGSFSVSLYGGGPLEFAADLNGQPVQHQMSQYRMAGQGNPQQLTTITITDNGITAREKSR